MEPREQVRVWRAPDDRVLLMAGRTTSYAMQPRGEYVFGVTGERPMYSRRAGERRLVPPGRLFAFDPSHPHAGTSVESQPWWARLMIVEIADLATIAQDEEHPIAADVAFPDPFLLDPGLAPAFLRLHASLGRPSASRLECDERLAEWLQAVVTRFGTHPSPSGSRAPAPREDRALRRACDYIRDQPERNIGLDELAAAAGSESSA